MVNIDISVDINNDNNENNKNKLNVQKFCPNLINTVLQPMLK